MVDPSELIDNLVTKLRAIADLVTEMDGDATRIAAYHDQFPDKSSLAQAVHDMAAPGILIVWNGTGPGNFGRNESWKHQIAAYLRMKAEVPGDAANGYYRLFRLITKGVPAGDSVPMNYLEIHPSFYPMDTPSIERDTDAEGLDYFRVVMPFTEIGDD